MPSFSKMSKSSLNEQCTFTMSIREIEGGVHALRNDTHTMIRGRTLGDTVEDEESSVDVVTEDFLSIIQGVRQCLRGGLKQQEGFTQITEVGQQSFWPLTQSVTPKANVDYILEQVAGIPHEDAEDVELVEVAWILLAINDGTLADYIQLCSETPMARRASWYTHGDNAVMLDGSKLEVLQEAAQQVCDIYFQIDLADVWYALKEDERVREMTLGDGLLAPSSSPVLVGTEQPQIRSSSTASTGKSIESVHSEVPELRRYSEGDQVQPIDKETLRKEAEDLDQVMPPPRRTSRLRSAISSIKERTISATNDLLSSAINVAEKQADKLRRQSRALSRESTVELPPQTAVELPPPPPTEQVVPSENVRVSLFERMRESFSALVGEPFDETDSEYSNAYEGARLGSEDPSERIPRASSAKLSVHSEKPVAKEPSTASIHSARVPTRPRLSSTLSDLSIDQMGGSSVEPAMDRQSLGSKKPTQE